MALFAKPSAPHQKELGMEKKAERKYNYKERKAKLNESVYKR